MLRFAPSLTGKWVLCILAYYRGVPVEWRNNGGTAGKPSEWHDLTPEMVEGRDVFAVLNKISGPVWNWPWMEFRIKAEPLEDLFHRNLLPQPRYPLGDCAQVV